MEPSIWIIIALLLALLACAGAYFLLRYSLFSDERAIIAARNEQTLPAYWVPGRGWVGNHAPSTAGTSHRLSAMPTLFGGPGPTSSMGVPGSGVSEGEGEGSAHGPRFTATNARIPPAPTAVTVSSGSGTRSTRSKYVTMGNSNELPTMPDGSRWMANRDVEAANVRGAGLRVVSGDKSVSDVGAEVGDEGSIWVVARPGH